MQPTELQMHVVYIVYLIPWLSGVTYCSTPTLINTGWTRNEVKYVCIYMYTFIHSTPNCAANRLHLSLFDPQACFTWGEHQTEGSACGVMHH